MRILLIDDMRDMNTLVAMWVGKDYKDKQGECLLDTRRNFQQGIKSLKYGGPWDLLFLDHDLASFDKDGKEKTGYDVMCFLEANPEFLPKKIICVSSNPVGRRRIQVVIDKLYGVKQ